MKLIFLITPPHPAHVDMKMIGMVGVIIGAEREIKIVAEAITNIMEKFAFCPSVVKSRQYANEAAIGHAET